MARLCRQVSLINLNQSASLLSSPLPSSLRLSSGKNVSHSIVGFSSSSPTPSAISAHGSTDLLSVNACACEIGIFEYPAVTLSVIISRKKAVYCEFFGISLTTIAGRKLGKESMVLRGLISPAIRSAMPLGDALWVSNSSSRVEARDLIGSESADLHKWLQSIKSRYDTRDTLKVFSRRYSEIFEGSR